MPLLTMITTALRCLRRLLAFTCTRKPLICVSKKAGKKPFTRVTVHDVIEREHTLTCAHGQKKSIYYQQGHDVEFDLVHTIVLPKTKFQYTRSKAKKWHEVYLHTTHGNMHTIICKYHELQQLRVYCSAVAKQSEV